MNMTTNKPLAHLSDSDGADAVALRHCLGRSIHPEPDDPGYCCERCGGDQFIVDVRLVTEVEHESILGCECGEHEHAAIQTFTSTYLSSATYLLDETHHFREHVETECLDVERSQSEYEVYCHECLDHEGDDTSLWAEDDPDPAHEEERVEAVTVRCDDCGHEIEFGWSHPGRGGRIWPCEAADFNPWRSWPEPRFREAWACRGWLRA